MGCPAPSAAADGKPVIPPLPLGARKEAARRIELHELSSKQLRALLVKLGGGTADGSHMHAPKQVLLRLAREAMGAAPLALLDEACVELEMRAEARRRRRRRRRGAAGVGSVGRLKCTLRVDSEGRRRRRRRLRRVLGRQAALADWARRHRGLRVGAAARAPRRTRREAQVATTCREIARRRRPHPLRWRPVGRRRRRAVVLRGRFV